MKSQNAGGQKKWNHIIVIVTFALVACALVGVAVYQKNFAQGDKPVVRARTVIPASNTGYFSTDETVSVFSDSVEATSFIELSVTETLLSSITFDFDGDNIADQVLAVRKSESPNIYLIVAIYVPSTNTYVRVAELETGIMRARTFSYVGIDLTGTHRMNLVYQGVRDDSMYLMHLYQCEGSGANAVVSSIGNFESDGTIFIQQADRSVSYELSQSPGSSFSVWVYSSDVGETDANANVSVGQIQTEYKWDESAKKYVQFSRRRIAGTTVAAAERAKILDGTIETFVRFLNGLWYKTTNKGDSIRFLYFDYDSREIIFLYEDAQEIYSWENSNLNQNGIYLTSSNAEIANLQRKFDIMLASSDTVQMHIIDDVRTLIREATVWDGEYRKMAINGSLASNKGNNIADEIKAALESHETWNANGDDNFSFSDNTYTFKFNSGQDSGAYSIYTVAGVPVIQFRSIDFASTNVQAGVRLAGAYRMEFGKTEIPASGRTPARTVENREEIIFTPVSLSPKGVEDLERAAITLTLI